MSKNNQALIEFLDQQKESGKYESFVWAEALGVFVVSCYHENFNFHFNKLNESHANECQILTHHRNRFAIHM